MSDFSLSVREEGDIVIIETTGYLNNVGDGNFMPAEQEDYNILLDTFLLEKAVYELNYELNNRIKWTLIPLRGIKSIIERYRNGQ